MQRSLARIPESLAGLTIEEAIEFEVLDALEGLLLSFSKIPAKTGCAGVFQASLRGKR